MAQPPLQPQIADRTYAGTQLPVGAIFMTVSDVNPAVSLGYGVWERFALGRCLFGLDETDTKFDEPEEVGGTDGSE